MDEDPKERRAGSPRADGGEDGGRSRFPGRPRQLAAWFRRPEEGRQPDLFLEAWLRSRPAP